jgi:hypothetical protein
MTEQKDENLQTSEVALKDSPTRSDIQEYLESRGETVLLCDGFDEAFLGLSQRINEPLLAVYSYDKMIDVLVKRDGMEHEDAIDYLDFNVLGAWVGEQTPIIVTSMFY